MNTLALAGAVLLSIFLEVPTEFQAETVVTLHTMTHKQINKQCGPDGKTWIIRACGDVNGPNIYMPNPCTYPEAKDHKSYAYLLCHEIAHTEGWTHK